MTVRTQLRGRGVTRRVVLPDTGEPIPRPATPAQVRRSSPRARRWSDEQVVAACVLLALDAIDRPRCGLVLTD